MHIFVALTRNGPKKYLVNGHENKLNDKFFVAKGKWIIDGEKRT